MPDTVLSVFGKLTYSIPIITLWGRYWYYPYFKGEGTEVWSGKVNCPRSHSEEVAP